MKPYYEDDHCTIYHGDCTEILPGIANVDLVFTSPPYNLGEGMEDKGGLRVGHNGSKWGSDRLRGGYGIHADDMPYPAYREWQRDILFRCWQTLTPNGAIFYNHKPRIVRGELRTPLDLTTLPIRQVITWDRGSGFNFMPGAYLPVSEWIVVMAREEFALRDRSASGVGDVWRIAPDTHTEHPAPFPVALPTRAIETTNANTILDPFMGSGTTLRAAKDLGRKAIGIELEERYCEIAAERLGQEVLFGEAA